MKKLSLQMRLTCLSALLLAACCLTLYLLIGNSALMKMDTLQEEVVSISMDGGENYVSLYVKNFAPELFDIFQNSRQAFQTQCLLITLVVIAVGSGLTWVISGIILRPLKQLDRQIEAVSVSNLSAQLPVPGSGDEISALTVSFNRMLQRLDGAFLSQRQFTANAAHELRTPLAVLQTSLEVFQKVPSPTPEDYRAILASTLRQTERLSGLTDSLLELMSLHTAPLTDRIELSGLTEEILCDLAPLAEEKGIALSCEGDAVTLMGNEVLLYRAISNLVENGIKYNRPEGRVQVRIRAEDACVRITVSDSGMGIDPGLWEEIFQPFYRVDKARSRSMGGAGLGLALVSDIADLHEGRVFVEDSTPQGTCITLFLPRNGG